MSDDTDVPAELPMPVEPPIPSGFPDCVNVRVAETDGQFDATVDGGVSPAVSVKGVTYEAAVQDVFIAALKQLCEGWAPGESFYLRWESQPQLRPSPPGPNYPPEIAAHIQREMDAFDRLDNPRMYNLVVHTKEHHFWTSYHTDRDKAVGFALDMLSSWLNNPLQRSPEDDLKVIAEEGEMYRNLWGSAL